MLKIKSIQELYKLKKLLLLSVFSVFVWGCVYTQPPSKIDENASLYERLGGMPAINKVMAEFTRQVARDERINGFFIGADLERVERLLAEQVCAATGGPCTYTGGDMVAVHTGMNITEAQFNALVEDLVKSLNTYRVRQREQQELLKILGSMKKDIINR